MSAGQIIPRQAYARHGIGYDRNGGSRHTTFVFKDEACTDPIGWTRGLKADGEVWDVGVGLEPLKLVVVGEVG